MRIPIIRGIIDRRILANYRIDADVMARVLPSPFRPKLADGYAIGGVCLVRLRAIRPRFIPFNVGFGSENAAHRIAVEWDANGQTQQGVYVPRRETNSKLNTLAGGRIFPGVYNRATFTVVESDEHISISLKSNDGETSLHVSGTVTDHQPESSVFPSVTAASEFFEAGALAYSLTPSDGRYDGLELRCKDWRVEALDIDRLQSSFFEDDLKFPPGSVEFDCALLMRGIEHEWHGRESLCCQDAIET